MLRFDKEGKPEFKEDKVYVTADLGNTIGKIKMTEITMAYMAEESTVYMHKLCPAYTNKLKYRLNWWEAKLNIQIENQVENQIENQVENQVENQAENQD
jgi:hypothetical protein